MIEFFTIRISVRLSDRSKVTQNKINFVKNCPQWGLILEINKVQHVKWCMQQKKAHFRQSPTDSCPAQLAEHKTDDQEVVGSNPIGGGAIFDEICFVLCNFRSLRSKDRNDRNASYFLIVKNPTVCPCCPI